MRPRTENKHTDTHCKSCVEDHSSVFHEACHGRDCDGARTPTGLIIHERIARSMKPSDPPPPKSLSHTHTRVHLLIRHGQLVLATVNQLAGEGVNWQQGCWRSSSGRRSRGILFELKGGVGLYIIL